MTKPQLERMKFWIVKPKSAINQIKNPTFASPDYSEDWSSSAGTKSDTDDYARFGVYSMKMTPASGADSSLFYEGVTVESGLAYTFSCYIKGVSGQTMSIYIANSSGVAKATTTFVATGYWQRVEVTWTSDANASNYEVWIKRHSIASTDPFYVDGCQFEQDSKASTFFDGYTAGCRWTGSIRNSPSERSGVTGLGGELLCINDYARILSVHGFGMGQWNQVMTKMTTGGNMYQTHIRTPRNVSMVLAYSGNNQGDMQANRKVLLDALRPDLLSNVAPLEQFGINMPSSFRGHEQRIIRYQGFDENDNEATNPVDIVCVFQPSHNDTPDTPVFQKDVLNFTVPSGLFQGAYTESKALDLYAEFPAENIVRRDPNGSWCYWDSGTGAYVNPLKGVGTGVFDIKEAPNGDIYVCGTFSHVSNGLISVSNTAGIARWSKANQVWESVGSPVTFPYPTVTTMVFDANGDLYIGGMFDNFAGIANADNFAKYTVSTNTWSAVGSGINSTVNAIAISPSGTIYIGGMFTEASGDTDCNHIAYLDGSVWKPLATGFNTYVNALKFRGAFLLIGGAFASADGVNGDYFCIWDGSNFLSMTDLGATELNGEVLSIDVTPNGTIIIGGEFTNAGGDGNGVDYLAAWENNNWRSLPAGRVNDVVYRVFCLENGDIYIAGAFTEAGDMSAVDQIVKSIQGTYQPLDIDLPGSSVDVQIYAICLASDGSLYLGGYFSTNGSGENAKTGAVALNLSVLSASANTYPVINLSGVGTLKMITNYTTGKSIVFEGLTLQAGEWASFNFDPLNLSFRSGWAGRGNLLRYVVAGSNYGDFYLSAGNNYISLFMDDTDANTKASIVWVPKFWGIEGALLE